MSSHFRPCSTQREDVLNEPNLVDEGLDLLSGDDRPLPNLGQVVIIVGDVRVDLLFQVVDGGKVSPAEDVLVENAEPDFDRIEPATMLGCIDKTDTMFGIAEIGLAGWHALEDARFSFFGLVLLILKGLGDETGQGRAFMGGESRTHIRETRPV